MAVKKKYYLWEIQKEAKEHGLVPRVQWSSADHVTDNSTGETLYVATAYIDPDLFTVYDAANIARDVVAFYEKFATTWPMEMPYPLVIGRLESYARLAISNFRTYGIVVPLAVGPAPDAEGIAWTPLTEIVNGVFRILAKYEANEPDPLLERFKHIETDAAPDEKLYSWKELYEAALDAGYEDLVEVHTPTKVIVKAYFNTSYSNDPKLTLETAQKLFPDAMRSNAPNTITLVIATRPLELIRSGLSPVFKLAYKSLAPFPELRFKDDDHDAVSSRGALLEYDDTRKGTVKVFTVGDSTMIIIPDKSIGVGMAELTATRELLKEINPQWVKDHEPIIFGNATEKELNARLKRYYDTTKKTDPQGAQLFLDNMVPETEAFYRFLVVGFPLTTSEKAQVRRIFTKVDPDAEEEEKDAEVERFKTLIIDDDEPRENPSTTIAAWRHYKYQIDFRVSTEQSAVDGYRRLGYRFKYAGKLIFERDPEKATSRHDKWVPATHIINYEDVREVLMDVYRADLASQFVDGHEIEMEEMIFSPKLVGTILHTNPTNGNKGDCFGNVFNLAKRFPSGTFVHAKVTPPGRSKPFWHAWMEQNERVYDNSPGSPYNRADYYRQLKPHNIKRYSAAQILINTVKHGHMGPWHR